MPQHGFSIRIEEYVPLAKVIKDHFDRDFVKINQKYPKLNNAFKDAFADKIHLVETQEKKVTVTAAQKATTASLYNEASELVEELIFIADYLGDASLDNTLVKESIHDLRAHNIEGATNKLEGVRQLIVANQASVEAEGMAPDFPNQLAVHIESLNEKNKQQKLLMDDGKVVTNTGGINYKDLYADVVLISDRARKVLKNAPYAEQYVINNIIQSMRSAKKNVDNNNQPS